MSATSGAIVEVEGEPAESAGHARHRATLVAFTLCLAVASAFVGRDGPAALAPVDAAATLSLPAGSADVVLVTFPDRLANEQPPPFEYTPVRVRATQGLAVLGMRPGDASVIYWTEDGTAYWLSSSRARSLSDLIRLAGSLR
jgi:hypothetical protein